MTADDWTAGAHPLEMIDEVLSVARPCDLRQFAAEVCRATGQNEVWAILSRAGNEDATGNLLVQVRDSNQTPAVVLRNGSRRYSRNPQRLACQEQRIRIAHAAAADDPREAARGAAAAAFPMLQRVLIPLIQCSFANPLRRVAFDPSWRTSTAVGLAAVMYEACDVANMPILADALEEAGCDHPDILAHCRGGGSHVRGCWVVDLVLGKS